MNLYEKCPVCDGEGRLRRNSEVIFHWADIAARRLNRQIDLDKIPCAQTCPVCEGSGKIVSDEGAEVLRFIRENALLVLPEKMVKFHCLDENPAH